MISASDRRVQLLHRLSELDSRLHQIESDLDSPHSKDWDEAAVETEGDEVLEGLGHQGAEEIRRIRAALQRIREGEYGFCVTCGAQVQPARLDLLPDTPFCATCANAHG